jgi:hypothetical protein
MRAERRFRARGDLSGLLQSSTQITPIESGRVRHPAVGGVRGRSPPAMGLVRARSVSAAPRGGGRGPARATSVAVCWIGYGSAGLASSSCRDCPIANTPGRRPALNNRRSAASYMWTGRRASTTAAQLVVEGALTTVAW